MSSKRKRTAIVQARFPAAATLFVCKRCSGGRALRRDLRSLVKVARRKRDLRIVSCGCLDVCPNRGAAAILALQGSPARCIAVGDNVPIDGAFLRELLDERVRNAVTD